MELGGDVELGGGISESSERSSFEDLRMALEKQGRQEFLLDRFGDGVQSSTEWARTELTEGERAALAQHEAQKAAGGAVEKTAGDVEALLSARKQPKRLTGDIEEQPQA